MRRRLLAGLAACGVAVAAAGCGVPGRSNVVVDGENRATDMTGSYGGEQLPPGPEGTNNNVEEFVNRFLEAPAGDWEGAAARFKQFLSPQQQAHWQPPRAITVVRLVSGKPDIKPSAASSVVALDVQQVGVLTDRGTLEPPTSQTTHYTFTVGLVDGPRGALGVTSPPPPMLLTDTALSQWYQQRSIYFWDTDQRNLVPDLRYMPLAEGDDARPRLLIDWLIGGPVAWLQPSVLELPGGTKQLRNAYKDNDRLIVNLNQAATGQDLDRLLAQLAWTVRDDFKGDLVLQIEYKKRLERSWSDYVSRNAAYQVASRGAEGFAVAGGVVHRVKLPGPPVPDEVPVLDQSVNKDVRSAAISGGHAALVRGEGDGQVLWVGPDRQGKFLNTGLRGNSMSRPVVADDLNVGYVAANGKLYQFSLDRKATAAVTAQGLQGTVTSVALAPDGRRLAVVAGGQPYLVALGGDGEGPTGIARPVPTTLSNLTGISWLSETKLAMTGHLGSRAALVKVSLDGAVLDVPRSQDLGTLSVTQLVSFPEDPVSGIGGPIMIEADNQAFEVFTSTQRALGPDQLSGPPVKGGTVDAPFFRE